jgi:hypothetical protein
VPHPFPRETDFDLVDETAGEDKAVTMRKFEIDIADYLQDAVREAVADDDDLVGALIGDLQRHDPRAEYFDDTFAVERVELLSEGRVRVTYKYEWGAHYGCQDLCCGAVQTEEVLGRIDEGVLVFDIKAFEPRSPEDEF